MDLTALIIFAWTLFVTQGRPIDKEQFDMDGQLVLLHTIWRHGDRTPIKIWPNDPNQEESWPEGLGQLTVEGIRQHVKLGKKLRQMYGNFLDPLYNSREIYVRSSDVNRTIVSAMSNMIGFFGDINFRSDLYDIEGWPLGYQPIPIHVIPEEYDELRALLQKGCQRYDELTKLIFETPEYVKLADENKDFLLQMRKMTGDDFLTFEKFGLLADTWRVEKLYNRSEMRGFTKEIYSIVEPIAFKTNNFKYGLNLEPYKGIDIRLETAKAHGGLLLWSIIDRMKQKRDCLDTNFMRRSKDYKKHCQWIDSLKYYVLSAHDNTLASLFTTLGFPKTNYKSDGYPPYAACLAIELRKHRLTQQYYVKLNYIVGENVIDVTNDVLGCSNSECTLDDFISRSIPYRIENVKQFCDMPLIN